MSNSNGICLRGKRHMLLFSFSKNAALRLQKNKRATGGSGDVLALDLLSNSEQTNHPISLLATIDVGITEHPAKVTYALPIRSPKCGIVRNK